MKRIVVIFSILIFVYASGISQSISGIENHYLQVQNISGDTVFYFDSTEDEEDFFQPGDKVLMIQMTGTYFNFSNPYKGLYTETGHRGCGNYEILQIAEINRISSYIRFTSDFTREFNDNEKIQLVKFIEYQNVTVSGTLQARDWDGGKGGVVAMMIYDTLRLNAGIDVSGNGFRGSLPETDYPGDCAPLNDSINFLPDQLHRAGNKGEGTITTSFPYTKGGFFAANGGGGGNRKFAGGGGGSNYLTGGVGGRQDLLCATFYEAMGGLDFRYFYDNLNRIIMGGGGGSGVQSANPPASYATKGGDGGGIIIVIADVLIANNADLKANGENVPDGASASGGGGGAGGTILLDIKSYIGTLDTISVKGGKGGGTNCTGTGGGGAGGVIKHPSSPAMPYNKVIVNGGEPGLSTGECITMGGNGVPGKLFSDFNLTLNGFLFNTLRGVDSICSGQRPATITGTQPRGGNGFYTYLWQQSIDQISWMAASGTGINSKDFTPSPLNTTTFFRRIVTSGMVNDTSKPIKIFVFPSINNNISTGSDSICSGKTPFKLTGSIPGGGDGTNYHFQWQSRNLIGTWTNLDGQTSQDYSPEALEKTTYYRRVITSDVCSSVSDSVTITVFDTIKGNGFAPEDNITICEGTDPGTLIPSLPQNGFGEGSYSYRWQQKSISSDWSEPTANTSSSFSPGSLIESMQFRRITYSGEMPLGCVSVSNALTVEVLDKISNNTVFGGNTQFTCSNSAKQLNGSVPAGGNGSYAYTWQMSSDSSNWANHGSEKDFTTPDLNSTALFRRIVYSSLNGRECKDTSKSVAILINDLPSGYLTGNLRDTICEGESVNINFNIFGGNGNLDIKLGYGSVSDSVKNMIAGTGSISFSLLSSQNIGILSIVDDSLCYADVNDLDAMEIMVYSYPDADAGNNAEVCGLTHTLSANQTGSMGLWSSESADFSNSSASNSDISVPAYGSYTVSWTESNWQCIDKDSIIVAFYEQPVTVDAGPDQSLNFEFQTTLEAVQPEVGSGKWTISQGSGNFENDTVFNTLVAGIGRENVYKWTITNGVCEPVYDSVNVLVSIDLKLPKGFLPDRQEYFAIYIDNAEKIEMTIFNRSGQIVFESDNYRDGDFWNGRYKNSGPELPEGTYFYILLVKLENQTEKLPYHKYVELIRGK